MHLLKIKFYFHTWIVNIYGVLKQKCLMEMTAKMNTCKHDNITLHFRSLFVSYYEYVVPEIILTYFCMLL
jgi:hypothetical protein